MKDVQSAETFWLASTPRYLDTQRLSECQRKASSEREQIHPGTANTSVRFPLSE